MPGVAHMIQVEVVADPNSPALKSLGQLELILSEASMAGFLKNFVVGYLQGRAQERFDMEGDDTVGKWVPLKESTLRIRAEKGFPSGPINVRTGELRDFVVNNPGSIGVDVGATLTWPTGLPEGNTLVYKYRVSQTGTMSGRVPPRPTVGMSFRDMAAINVMLGGFIDSAKKAGA